MDKTEANKRLAAIESEAAALREIINAPEYQAPKRGDVFQWDDDLLIAYEEDHAVNLGTGYRTTLPLSRLIEKNRPRTLGKHSDVFMRRDEVRKAIEDILQTEDDEGETLADCADHGTFYSGEGVTRIVEKLRKLAE